MNCPKCNTPLEAGDVFCPGCGVKLQATQEKKASDPRGKPKKKVLILLAAAVPVLLVAVAAVAMFAPRGTAPDRDWLRVDGFQERSFTGYMEQFNKKASLIIENETHNTDGTGTADATVTVPNMGKLMDALWEEIQARPNDMSREEIQAYLQDELKKADCPMITESIQVVLKEIDGEWKIVPDEAFEEAMTGHMISSFNRHYYEYLMGVDGQ